MSAEHIAQLRMIGESAAAFAAAHGGSARARRVHEGASAWDAATWKAIAGLGWTGIAVPEHKDGLGLGAPALAVVSEQAGRALMTAPLTMGIAAACVLAHGASPAGEALGALLAGDAHVVLAEGIAADGDGTVHASLVPEGEAASAWLVATGEGEAFGARVVHVDAPGAVRSDRAAVDGSRLAGAAIEHSVWVDAPRVL
ncbi:acyl-CoA dehydrogenase family protein [Variovorax sp. DT-64]|uniref:acyl-CoA dehydrogenase family protein n=1 Tax=Variovorax sp. DT-64 TaxID=3396160 RepID=UPI003F19944D